MDNVSIPVMAKCRIGHFAEAQILQELGVDYIDESEVLTPADEAHHVNKHAFTVPFVCGARDLGEALRRIAEGAAMIRTKGEAGTGDVVHAVKHLRQIVRDMKQLTVLSDEELYAQAKELRAPYELVRLVAKVRQSCRFRTSLPAELPLLLTLPWFASWAPKRCSLARESSCRTQTTFCDPVEAEKRAKAIVRATTHFDDPKVLLEVSHDLVGAMKGLAVLAMSEGDMMQTRGW